MTALQEIANIKRTVNFPHLHYSYVTVIGSYEEPGDSTDDVSPQLPVKKICFPKEVFL